jgi:valyl-tRNA synthetase
MAVVTDNTQRPDSGPNSAPELPTQYTPAEVEGSLYERWVERGYFEADAKSDKPAYTIVIPPPNVTGSLHLGHAFEHTLIDALTRRKRMQGYETLWQPGMDHAGIATQNVVERELAKEGKSRHDLGREAFVERVWQWKAESGGQIAGQMRRLGNGVAWSRDRFTMDEGLSRAVQTVFKKMFDDGLIYRAERIINWCPRCLTAISDIEVDYQDDDGELVSIKYGEGDDTVVVATTRAETMLGDTAVAVHPDDERYKHLVGRRIALPLTGRTIPVVADTHVDPEFGTGAVKVTPAHDPNDFAIGQRHGLESLTVMDERGVITVHGPFEGLDRFEARSAIVAALRADGRIVAEKRPYVHSVGHCSRCKTTLEPRLSLQWWVKVETLAKAAGDAVRDGRVDIHPADLSQRYFDWVDNLNDWCISRQLWWGHRIPVWHGPNGETVCVGPDEQPPSGEGWEQDTDVLDTWFSSGLWPFSTLGWPEKTADLAKFYPNSAMVTGYDLMFFWVARMMMFGLYAMDGEIPFHTIAFHGMVRDEHGKKMSKSFGNTVNPLDWMDKGPGVPELRQQDLERDAVRDDERRHDRGRAAPGRTAVGDGPLDPVPAEHRRRRGGRVLRRLPVREARRCPVPLRVGRGLRLVRRAVQDDVHGRRRRGQGLGTRPGRGPGRDAAPAASHRSIRDGDAVDHAHRPRVHRDRRLADGQRVPRCRGRG